MSDRFGVMRYPSRDGLQLYCRDYGDRKTHKQLPLICLHGLTRNSRDFERLASELSADCRVLCPDFRGRGESGYDPDWRNYHPAQYARDIELLIARLGLEQFRLLGTSLGGMVATLLAGSLPSQVAAVVLNDIGPEIHPLGLSRIVESAGLLADAPSFADALANTKANYELALPGWSEEDWCWYTSNTYRAAAGRTYTLNYDRQIGTAVRAGLAGIPGDPYTVFDALAALPTLLVRGELSDVMTADIAARMQTRKPDLRIVCVANRGHVPILDEPEAIDAIKEFLAEH